MSNITFYSDLFIEETELNRMIKFLDVLGYKKMLVAFTETFGIVKSASDIVSANFTKLKVYESSSGKIGVRLGMAFDSSGNLIDLAADYPDAITVPNDSTFYKIFIAYAQTQIEAGTVSVASNGVVTGTGTVFTELFKVGKKIEIINSTLGNNGTFDITVLTDNTHITTPQVFVAESGLNFKVKGVYTPGVSISDGNSRPYWLDTCTITLEADSAVSSNTKFYLARVKNIAGVLTITDTRTQIHTLKQANIAELTNGYTTASAFYVDADEGTGSNGKKVLTVDDIAPFAINKSTAVLSDAIRNLYVKNVNSIGYGDRILVDFEWGFHNIVGHTDGTEFHITSGYDSVTQETILGQYLYIPAYGSFRIDAFTPTSGGVTVITSLSSSDGSVYPVGTVTLTANNPGLIHPNGMKYSFRAVPVIGGVEQKEDIINYGYDIDGGGDIFDNNKVQIKLYVGVTYNIKVTIFRGTTSISRNLPAGTLTKYAAADVTYDYPWIVTYPNLADDGAITVTDKGNKINIVTAGWADADDFECVYTSVGDADFSSSSQPKVSFTSRNFDITVTPAIYKLKVRPRVAFQQVQTPKDATVSIVSKGDGKSISDTLNLTKIIGTYSGSIGTVTSATAWGSYPAFNLPLTSVKTPSGGSNVPTKLNLRGMYLKDSNNNLFLVDPDQSNIVSGGAITIVVLDTSGNSLTPVTGAFTMGKDATSREVLRGIVQAPMTVLSLEANTDFATLGAAIFRVYNSKDPATFDTLSLPSGMKGSAFVAGAGNVTFATGDTYVATMYDSADAYNTGCFSGTFKVVLGNNDRTLI